MRLLLIRHGETVDNVAGLYAGVRDSALTIHGVEQARRLGVHLAAQGLRPTHIFASPLQRAFKTAEALIEKPNVRELEMSVSRIQIVRVNELIEQNFGFYEGKPFHARSRPQQSGKDAHRAAHEDQPGFVDVETKDAMAKRADAFLDEHLLPLFNGVPGDNSNVIAVVSHGILLSSLWKRVLLRLPKKSLIIAPEATASRGEIVLEHLGGWSNTGYLYLCLRRNDPRPAEATISQKSDAVAPSGIISQTVLLYGWSVSILAIDSKQHLQGLKRQRGGIGRMAHDEGQKKLDNFFKKQRKT